MRVSHVTVQFLWLARPAFCDVARDLRASLQCKIGLVAVASTARSSRLRPLENSLASPLTQRIARAVIAVIFLAAPAPWASPSLPGVDLAQASTVLKDLVLATLA